MCVTWRTARTHTHTHTHTNTLHSLWDYDEINEGTWNRLCKDSSCVKITQTCCWLCDCSINLSTSLHFSTGAAVAPPLRNTCRYNNPPTSLLSTMNDLLSLSARADVEGQGEFRRKRKWWITQSQQDQLCLSTTKLCRNDKEGCKWLNKTSSLKNGLHSQIIKILLPAESSFQRSTFRCVGVI